MTRAGIHAAACAHANDHRLRCNCGLVSACAAGVEGCTRESFHIHDDDGIHEADEWFTHKAQLEAQKREQVHHPNHYGGDSVYETIKVLAAWKLGFLLGNCAKYISRAGKKDPAKLVEDLKKARFYLDYAIARLERGEELF